MLAHFLSDFKLLILKGGNVTEALEAPRGYQGSAERAFEKVTASQGIGICGWPWVGPYILIYSTVWNTSYY